MRVDNSCSKSIKHVLNRWFRRFKEWQRMLLLVKAKLLTRSSLVSHSKQDGTGDSVALLNRFQQPFDRLVKSRFPIHSSGVTIHSVG